MISMRMKSKMFRKRRSVLRPRLLAAPGNWKSLDSAINKHLKPRPTAVGLGYDNHLSITSHSSGRVGERAGERADRRAGGPRRAALSDWARFGLMFSKGFMQFHRSARCSSCACAEELPTSPAAANLHQLTPAPANPDQPPP
ncbi:unnamed protein product [Colias eurytheme]|nr:unnamed protein product [Colias eurytheme]